MKDKDKKQKVFVGMSGGVDSSVSAALLKQQGFNVVGVFIKAWEPFASAQDLRPIVNTQDLRPAGFDCGWREERRDAMRVAAHLDIPFLTLDLSKEYKKEVVDYMVAEYRVGRTPNPDVMCNQAIKFGAFFDWAVKQGADYVATGHYARTQNVRCQMSKVKYEIQKTEEKYEMLAGVDKNKDQSYFLWTLTQKQLTRTLFPIGNLTKPEVRKLATKFDLSNQTKKDSQGLCFIGKLDIKDFLREFIKAKAGEVLDLNGNVIGRHNGVLFYTLGERHGFEIFKKTPNEQPLYVVAKDLKNNTLTVSDTPFVGTDTNNKEIIIESVNWTSGQIPDRAKKYQARIRYRQPLQSCYLEVEPPSNKGQGQSDTYCVVFAEPQASISSGQSLVIYDGEVCLGGGIIA